MSLLVRSSVSTQQFEGAADDAGEGCCCAFCARPEQATVPSVGAYVAAAVVFFACIVWDALVALVGEEDAALYLVALSVMLIFSAMAGWWASAEMSASSREPR